MSKLIELVPEERKQLSAYTALSLAVLICAGLGYWFDDHLFARFLGDLNPLPVIPALVFLGLALSHYLLSRGWFRIYKSASAKALILWSGLAVLFGIMAITADFRIVFPADMNILLPGSLLFYPAIGFVVEVLFHLLPLSVFLIILASIYKKADRNKIIWSAIFIVSLVEPVYQIASGFWERYPAWAPVWVGAHVFLINIAQLTLYKRSGFIAMYSFRLLYYSIWHIAWGYFRLKILF